MSLFELGAALFGGGIASQIVYYVIQRIWPPKTQEIEIEEAIRKSFEHHITYLQSRIDKLQESHIDCETRCTTMASQIRELSKQVGVLNAHSK